MANSNLPYRPQNHWSGHQESGASSPASTWSVGHQDAFAGSSRHQDEYPAPSRYHDEFSTPGAHDGMDAPPAYDDVMGPGPSSQHAPADRKDRHYDPPTPSTPSSPNYQHPYYSHQQDDFASGSRPRVHTNSSQQHSDFASTSRQRGHPDSSQYQNEYASNSRPRVYTDSSQYQGDFASSARAKDYSGSNHPADLPPTPDSLGGQDEILSQALEFTKHRPPPRIKSARLAQIVAIPQTSPVLGAPFDRAYSPALEGRGISEDEFLEFIDNLNVVALISSPLQVLDLAGSVVSMVPGGLASLLGNTISKTAKVGGATLSKTRSALYMRRANKDFFAPRGLQVEIVSTETMRYRARLRADVPYVLPLAQSSGLTLQQRRVGALDGHISPLNFDVPLPNNKTNALERMTAKQERHEAARSETQMLRDRDRAFLKSGDSKSQRKLDETLTMIDIERMRVQRKAQEEMARRSKDPAKIEKERDKELAKLSKEIEKAHKEFRKEEKKGIKEAGKDDKEIKHAKKIMWIVVENL